ncbi:MAG: hypothetical protein K2H09_09065 [Treponemataceae bacterium]|nr:hypothetical protein [Treponemataceae bacterium]
MKSFPPDICIRPLHRKPKAPRKNARQPCAAVITALLFCLAPAASGAESFASRRILSFDLGYLGTGLKNNGWGLGLSYEAALPCRLAVKGGFSHMTMMPKGSDMTVTTVGVQLEALCYPFGRGLDWLYVGAACGTDFFMYKGGAVSDGSRQDTLVSLLGEIGWKQNFFNYVMADAFIGYRHPLNSGSNAFSGEIMRQGLEYGVRFKLNLPAIFGRIFRKRGAAADSAGAAVPAEEAAAAGADAQAEPESEAPDGYASDGLSRFVI